MPIDFDFAPSSTPLSPVAAVAPPAAVIELSGLFCEYRHDGKTLPQDVIQAADTVWGDDHVMLTEPVVLAHATGHLLDPTLEPFLERLATPVRFDAPLGLETETPQERELTNRRLDRLARDRRLRANYVAVLRDLWSAIAERWDAGIRDSLTMVGAEWQSRLDGGDDVLQLLPETHICRRFPQYGEMTRTAFREGTLILTPSSTARHIIALPGHLSVGAKPEPNDGVAARRRSADEIVKRLRPLADATRITILSQLAAAPSGVSDLARTLHLAQPTTSVHLRQLREAGLVDMRRDGSRTIYSARPDAIGTLLREVGAKLGAPADADRTI